MRNDLLIVFGGMDPEMIAILRLCKQAGIEAKQATYEGKPVNPGTAYKADRVHIEDNRIETVILVECKPVAVDPPNSACGPGWADDHDGHCPSGGWPKAAGRWCLGAPRNVVVIDHHSPGDPGYGFPPEKFWEGSSLGQFVNWLNANGHSVPVNQDMLLAAASDHCPGHAYQGKCPGVDPKDLLRHRAEVAAAFRKVAVETIEEEVYLAEGVLEHAHHTRLNGFLAEVGIYAVDLIQRGHIPSLPEAALRLGKVYLSRVVDRDGRAKIVMGGCSTPEHVLAFKQWAQEAGLIDFYGDPARGYAGAYEPKES